MTQGKNSSKVVTLADLRTAHGRLSRAEEKVSQERHKRDQAIRQLLDQGQSVKSVAEALGLARQSVMQIRDQGKTGTPKDLGMPLF